jgi:hypothetical protein
MTKGGPFQTHGVCPVKLHPPKLSTQERVKFHVDSSTNATKSRCNVITGRDLSEQLPSDVKFSDKTSSWQEVTVPVKLVDQPDKRNICETVERWQPHCFLQQEAQ